MEGRKLSQQEMKMELVRAFGVAAELAESIEPAIKISSEERSSSYHPDFVDLPDLPSIQEDFSVHDDDFRILLGIQSKRIAEETVTSSGIASDARRMAICIEADEVDLEEAQQILAMMTEELDKKVDVYLDSSEEDEEIDEQYDDNDDVAKIDESEDVEYTLHSVTEPEEKDPHKLAMFTLPFFKTYGMNIDEN